MLHTLGAEFVPSGMTLDGASPSSSFHRPDMVESLPPPHRELLGVDGAGVRAADPDPDIANSSSRATVSMARALQGEDVMRRWTAVPPLH